MNIAEQIKYRINMRDVLDRYGIAVNRKGFAKCPLHGEKTASFGIYDKDRKYHCFGCGKSGDILKFVQEYFNIDFRQAIVKLNSDFCLNLPLNGQKQMSAKERKEMLDRERERKQLKAERERIKADKELQYAKAFARYHGLIIALQEFKPKTQDEELHPRFIEALTQIDNAEYELNYAEREYFNYENRNGNFADNA